MRQDVVPLRPSFRQERIADREWEWEIGETVAMQMAKFTAADAELDTAKAMRAGDHALPRRHCLSDLRRS